MADTYRRQALARDAEGPPDHRLRITRLAALESLVRDHAEEWCEAIDADFHGRSSRETRLLEVFPLLGAIAHARRNLRGWMRPRRVATNLWFLPARSRVQLQPRGVVGIVVPWNYPLYLAAGPLVDALAAGNRAVVKMPEAAPRTGALFARLAAKYFDPAVVAVVTGGPDVAREFVALAWDQLLFTGSTAVGREVMRAAAANLTPVILELGGKSPAIVGRGVPIEEAAAKILHGKCLNAGQTCIAPDYVLVPEEHLQAFVVAARRTVRKLYPTLRDNPDYTAIIDERHRERLRSTLAEAVAGGAVVTPAHDGGEDFSGSPKMAPVLVVGAPEGSRLMRDEIFGPILPLVPYRAIDDAIAYVNARPRPLALYLFERDAATVERVLARTVSGGVSVNETLLHIAQDELPFGGVGPSGMGEYHGRAGFEAFSKRKAVFRQSRLNGLGLFRPPYGPRIDALLKLLLR